VVKAEVEGLGFSIPSSVDIEGCHLYTSIDYINRNILFSSNYMLQVSILFSMGKFVVHVYGLC
jgi:hypothetical protein